MPLTFVVAIRCIDSEDVAVPSLQLFYDTAFVHDARSAVIGERTKENGVFTIFGIQSA